MGIIEQICPWQVTKICVQDKNPLNSIYFIFFYLKIEQSSFKMYFHQYSTPFVPFCKQCASSSFSALPGTAQMKKQLKESLLLMPQSKDLNSLSKALSASAVSPSKCHFAIVTFKTHFKLEDTFSSSIQRSRRWHRKHHSQSGAKWKSDSSSSKPLASEDHDSFL